MKTCARIGLATMRKPVVRKSSQNPRQWPLRLVSNTLWPFQWELKDRSSAIWAGSAAVALGIPSIDIEAGGRGIIDEDAIAKIEEGFHRIVAHLGISKQTYPTLENQRIIFDRESIKAPQDGSWVPVKHAGGDVTEGELLGYVTDLHGRKVFEARSPKDGLLMLILSAPPVRKGETLATIASTKAAESPP